MQAVGLGHFGGACPRSCCRFAVRRHELLLAVLIVVGPVFLLLEGGEVDLGLLLVFAGVGGDAEPLLKGVVVAGQRKSLGDQLEEELVLPFPVHQVQVLNLLGCYHFIGAQQLEEVHQVLVLHGYGLPEGVGIKQVLDLVLQHLVELLLEVVVQLLALVGYLSVLLEELAELLEAELSVDAPLVEEEGDSAGDELILGGLVLLWEQLVVRVAGELLGFLDLEGVGEGFDEGGDEGVVEVGLALGGYEFVEGVGVVAIEVKGLAGCLQAELRLGEEGEVVFQNIEVHQQNIIISHQKLFALISHNQQDVTQKYLTLPICLCQIIICIINHLNRYRIQQREEVQKNQLDK